MPDNYDRDDLDEELDAEEEGEEEVDTEGEEDSGEEDFSPEEYKKLKAEFERTQAALRKANKEAQERRHKLKKLEQEGIDIDEAVELKRQIKQKEQEQAKKQGNIEKLQQQFEDRLNQTEQQYKAQLEKMKGSLHETLVTKEISAALNELGAVKNAQKVVVPIMKNMVDVQEDDNGKYQVVLLDEDGDAKFGPDGNYMSIRDAIAEMRNDELFSNFFVQSNHSGTGSTGTKNQKGAGKQPPKKKADMTDAEKTAYIGEHGMNAYLELK